VNQWRTLTIAGLGLIGGSFALALREAGFQGRIIGVSSLRSTQAALERGIINQGLPLEEAAVQSDAIYLAQPIEQILETLDRIDPFVRPGTLITDAGSTKRTITDRAARSIKRGRFIGGHPMAGKETRGVEAAEAGLFRGRPYVLTSSDPELEGWILKTGARLVHLDPAGHDQLVALVSHLPQLLSTALAVSLESKTGFERVAGPAALDLTRLALSPYEIWRDIFATNALEIDAALGGFISKLQEIREKLTDPAMEEEFARAAEAARRLRQDRT